MGTVALARVLIRYLLPRCCVACRNVHLFKKNIITLFENHCNFFLNVLKMSFLSCKVLTIVKANAARLPGEAVHKKNGSVNGKRKALSESQAYTGEFGRHVAGMYTRLSKRRCVSRCFPLTGALVFGDE